jgi:pyridoxine 4-dehydrogenase
MTDITAAGVFSLGDRTVNRLGYGAMQLAGPGVFGPPKDRGAALAVLRAAVASGVNHIDTSDYYGPHVTNLLIREALHPYPDDLVIVTKVGAVRGDDASWIPAITPADLTSAVHDNLLTLRVDALDVVNLRVGGIHEPNESSIEEQFATLAELQRQGLIRQLGLSNVTSAQINQARSIADIVCVQNHYNLVHRDDDLLIDELVGRGVAYVPSSHSAVSRVSSHQLSRRSLHNSTRPRCRQLWLGCCIARQTFCLSLAPRRLATFMRT